MPKDPSAELMWSGSSKRKTEGNDAGMVTGVRLDGEGDGRVEAFGVDATMIKDDKPKNYRRTGRFKVTIEQ